jgi:hypothetical protein
MYENIHGCIADLRAYGLALWRGKIRPWRLGGPLRLRDISQIRRAEGEDAGRAGGLLCPVVPLAPEFRLQPIGHGVEVGFHVPEIVFGERVAARHAVAVIIRSRLAGLQILIVLLCLAHGLPRRLPLLPALPVSGILHTMVKRLCQE